MPSVQVRTLGLALAIGGVVVGALGGAVAVRAAGSVAVPVTSLTALFLVAAKPLLDRAGRWAIGDRGPIVTCLSLLGAALVLFAIALYTMSDPPLVTWAPVCGTGRAALALIAPLAIFAWIATCTLAAARAVAPENGRADAALHIASVLAFTVGGVLAAAAGVRASRYPDTDHWLDAQPVVKRVRAGSESGAASRTDLGGLVLESTCADGECTVGIVPVGDERSSPARALHNVRAEETLVVRRDAVHDLWILDGRWWRGAYHGSSAIPRDVHLADINDTASAPRGWIAGLAGGLLVAVAALWRRRAEAQRLARITVAQEGTLGDNGWVSFEDGVAPLRAPAKLVPGPVLVIARAPPRGPAYRTDGSWADATLVAGTRAEHALVTRRAMAKLDALAITATVLTAAPVAVAAIEGLVL